MAPDRQRDHYALCPLFLSHQPTEIHCEGVSDAAKMVMRWGRDPGIDRTQEHEEKNWWKTCYCEGHYEYCPVYRMIMRLRYDDD